MMGKAESRNMEIRNETNFRYGCRRSIRAVGRHSGFTLIELLVSIGIVLVLVSMLMGGLDAARRKARRTRARGDVSQIATAWAAYYTEYKHFPDAGPGNSYTIGEMDEVSIQILRGASTNTAYQAKNPRKSKYMDFHSAVKEFLDPWNNPYQIKLDSAPYDGYVNVPQESTPLRHSVAVWSNGEDGEEGTADDVCSWKER
jgi:prepilin-type N-terminal cleavage/methylation domain-containing protein